MEKQIRDFIDESIERILKGCESKVVKETLSYTIVIYEVGNVVRVDIKPKYDVESYKITYAQGTNHGQELPRG